MAMVEVIAMNTMNTGEGTRGDGEQRWGECEEQGEHPDLEQREPEPTETPISKFPSTRITPSAAGELRLAQHRQRRPSRKANRGGRHRTDRDDNRDDGRSEVSPWHREGCRRRIKMPLSTVTNIRVSAQPRTAPAVRPQATRMAASASTNDRNWRGSLPARWQ